MSTLTTITYKGTQFSYEFFYELFDFVADYEGLDVEVDFAEIESIAQMIEAGYAGGY